MSAMLPGLDRGALFVARVDAKMSLADADRDPLTRAEMAGRHDVIEALLGMRDLAAVVAEYRGSYRPDPGMHLHRSEVTPHDLREHSSFGALEAYFEFTEGLPDARRCGYSGCGARIVLGVDDSLAGDYDDVFCADPRGCYVEHRIECAFARSGR